MENTEHNARSLINSLMESIKARQVFTPKYKTAKTSDDLLLRLTEAIAFIAGIILQKVQGDKYQENPNRRLFVESVGIIQKGLRNEMRKCLPFREAYAIVDRASIFACVIFASLNHYSQDQKSALLADYKDVESDQKKEEFGEQVMRLFAIAGLHPDGKTAIPLLLFFSDGPWQRVEVNGFADCWKNLNSSERFVF